MKGTFYHRAVSPWAYQTTENKLAIIFRYKQDDVKSAKAIFKDSMGVELGDQDFVKISTNNGFDFYKAEIITNAKRLRYVIEVNSKTKKYVFGENGIQEDKEKYFKEGFGFTWGYVDPDNTFKVPDWYKDTNWYQIFPDRFNKSKDSDKYDDWNVKEISNQHYLGGDLKGISNKLDYIKSLGFNGVYFTPIFEAKTIHRYDTINYYKIDPTVGTEKDFDNLIKLAHKKGMKIMLDGVFNHIGWASKQWLDVIEKKEESKYKDWFFINDFKNIKKPSEYDQKNGEFRKAYPFETFADVPEMPKLNWSNPEVKNFLIKAIKKWTKKGIDGWRLDVSFEPTFNFWRTFKEEVIKINPDIVIIGEVWWDSINYLQGDMWSGVMNYPLRNAIYEYFVENNSIDQLAERMNYLNVTYTPLQNQGMLNLISSHDVARFITLIKNDVTKYKAALGVLYFLQGSISIYYGQEIGLEGGNDPDNRRAMLWDEETTYKDDFISLNNIKRKYINKINPNSHLISVVKNNKLIMEYQNENLELSLDSKTNEVVIKKNNKIIWKSNKESK